MTKLVRKENYQTKNSNRMKKIVVIALFFSFFLNTSFAQFDFRFGFQASPTFSWMNTNDNQINGNGTNLGLKLGVLGENYFSERYALTFGLGFAFNMGGTLNHTQGGDFWANSELNNVAEYHLLQPETNLKYGLQYVEIPVGFKMVTQEFGYLRFYAHLPVFTLGILTQAKGDISGPNVVTEIEDLDIKKDVNFINLSWGIGGGVEYSIGENTSLFGGISFQNSFIDISKNKNAKKFVYDELSGGVISEEAEDSKANMGGITVNLGVMF